MSTNADGWQAESSYDLAERYVSQDTLEEGDVVTFSAEGDLGIAKAADNQKPFMGIVSTKPGFVLGKYSTSTYPVALAGRVPTKVSDAKGAIAIGDQLTVSSDNPGIAVKATEAGFVIGIALEAFPGGDDSLIEVFVQAGWYGAGSAPATVMSGPSAPSTLEVPTKRGFADVMAGATKVTVTFSSMGAYPNIQASSYGEVEGGWWINQITDTGFEIVLKQAQTRDVRFAWRAEATQSGENVYYSDNTYSPIDPVTGTGGGVVIPTSTESGTESPPPEETVSSSTDSGTGPPPLEPAPDPVPVTEPVTVPASEPAPDVPTEPAPEPPT